MKIEFGYQYGLTQFDQAGKINVGSSEITGKIYFTRFGVYQVIPLNKILSIFYQNNYKSSSHHTLPATMEGAVIGGFKGALLGGLLASDRVKEHNIFIF